VKGAYLGLATVIVGLLAGLWIGGHPENLPDPVRDVFVESSLATSGGSLSDEAAGVIDRKYFRETDPSEVQDASIRGMISRLRKQYDDRFSHFFDEKQLASFNESIDGSFSGVGMTVGSINERGLRVGFVFRNSPAADADIESGDLIVTVDGDSVKGQSVDLVVAEIKGPEGTDVELGVRRQGKGKPRPVNLTRRQIRVPVTSNRVEEINGQSLGYVRLATFSQGSGQALARAVDKVMEKGAEGLVLDLRANGGGLLPEAVLTSSVFVPEGEVVVETKSRTAPDEMFRAIGGDIGEYPVTVLVNRDTASAAEILAAALQTNVDAPVVGTRTFGKGVFQQVINLEGGGALDLTVGEFFTADGVSLAGKGLEPDVLARLKPDAESDTQLDRAFQVLGDEVDAAQAADSGSP
jgi:carboxyl-terminal processing protease